MKVKKLEFNVVWTGVEVAAIKLGIVNFFYSIEYNLGEYVVTLIADLDENYKCEEIGRYQSPSEAKEAAQRHFENLVNDIIERVTEE